uniref:USP domain-containing protein n=2 Tax=Caenorhabditis tropicalis TaxID=1561998 RepID=A0A1I7T5T8_9PELO
MEPCPKSPILGESVNHLKEMHPTGRNDAQLLGTLELAHGNQQISQSTVSSSSTHNESLRFPSSHMTSTQSLTHVKDQPIHAPMEPNGEMPLVEQNVVLPSSSFVDNPVLNPIASEAQSSSTPTSTRAPVVISEMPSKPAKPFFSIDNLLADRMKAMEPSVKEQVPVTMPREANQSVKAIPDIPPEIEKVQPMNSNGLVPTDQGNGLSINHIQPLPVNNIGTPTMDTVQPVTVSNTQCQPVNDTEKPLLSDIQAQPINAAIRSGNTIQSPRMNDVQPPSISNIHALPVKNIQPQQINQAEILPVNTIQHLQRSPKIPSMNNDQRLPASSVQNIPVSGTEALSVSRNIHRIVSNDHCPQTNNNQSPQVRQPPPINNTQHVSLNHTEIPSVRSGETVSNIQASSTNGIQPLSVNNSHLPSINTIQTQRMNYVPPPSIKNAQPLRKNHTDISPVNHGQRQWMNSNQTSRMNNIPPSPVRNISINSIQPQAANKPLIPPPPVIANSSSLNVQQPVQEPQSSSTLDEVINQVASRRPNNDVLQLQLFNRKVKTKPIVEAMSVIGTNRGRPRNPTPPRVYIPRVSQSEQVNINANNGIQQNPLPTSNLDWKNTHARGDSRPTVSMPSVPPDSRNRINQVTSSLSSLPTTSSKARKSRKETRKIAVPQAMPEVVQKSNNVPTTSGPVYQTPPQTANQNCGPSTSDYQTPSVPTTTVNQPEVAINSNPMPQSSSSFPEQANGITDQTPLRFLKNQFSGFSRNRLSDAENERRDREAQEAAQKILRLTKSSVSVTNRPRLTPEASRRAGGTVSNVQSTSTPASSTPKISEPPVTSAPPTTSKSIQEHQETTNGPVPSVPAFCQTEVQKADSTAVSSTVSEVVQKEIPLHAQIISNQRKTANKRKKKYGHYIEPWPPVPDDDESDEEVIPPVQQTQFPSSQLSSGTSREQNPSTSSMNNNGVRTTTANFPTETAPSIMNRSVATNLFNSTAAPTCFGPSTSQPNSMINNLSNTFQPQSDIGQNATFQISQPTTMENSAAPQISETDSASAQSGLASLPPHLQNYFKIYPYHLFEARCMTKEFEKEKNADFEIAKRKTERAYNKVIFWSRTVMFPPLEAFPKPKREEEAPVQKPEPKPEPPVVVVKPRAPIPSVLTNFPVDTIFQALIDEPVGHESRRNMKPIGDLVREKQEELDALARLNEAPVAVEPITVPALNSAAPVTVPASEHAEPVPVMTQEPTESVTAPEQEPAELATVTAPEPADLAAVPAQEHAEPVIVTEPVPAELVVVARPKPAEPEAVAVQKSAESVNVTKRPGSVKRNHFHGMLSEQDEREIEAAVQIALRIDERIKREHRGFVAPTKPVSVAKQSAQSATIKKKGRPKGSTSKKVKTPVESDTESLSEERDEDEDDYEDEDFDIERAVKEIDDVHNKAKTGRRSRYSGSSSDSRDDPGPSTSQEPRTSKRKAPPETSDTAPKQRRSERLRTTAVTAHSEHEEMPESPRDENHNKKELIVKDVRKTKRERTDTPASRRNSTAGVQTSSANAAGPSNAKRYRFGIRIDYTRRVSNETIESLLAQIMTPAAPEKIVIMDYFDNPIVRRAIVNRNTLCYAISMVQLLLRVPQVYSIIRSHTHKNRGFKKPQCFLCMLGSLISERPSVDDNPEFVAILKSSWKNIESEEMHCVMEAMQHFFYRFDEEYMHGHPAYVGKVPTICSPIRKFFEIDLIVDYKCRECEFTWSNPDKAIYISVDLTKKSDGTMQNMVDNMANPSAVPGLKCRCCNVEALNCTTRFTKLPEVLLYFVPRVRSKKREKDVTVVSIQKLLILKDNQNVHNYALCSFLTHHGASGHKGHYKSYEVDRSKEVQFNEFDDGKVIMNSRIPSDINVVLAMFRKDHAVAKDAQTDIIFDGRGNVAYAHEKHFRQD